MPMKQMLKYYFILTKLFRQLNFQYFLLEMYLPLSKVLDYRFDNFQFICTFSKSVVVMLFLNDFEEKKKKRKKNYKNKTFQKYFFSIVLDYTNLHTCTDGSLHRPILDLVLSMCS